ncbi:MAG: sugar transferase [Sphingobacteriales bacterium]|nr:sugar transferase [Sphingobacteriales bacterium]
MDLLLKDIAVSYSGTGNLSNKLILNTGSATAGFIAGAIEELNIPENSFLLTNNAELRLDGKQTGLLIDLNNLSLKENVNSYLRSVNKSLEISSFYIGHILTNSVNKGFSGIKNLLSGQQKKHCYSVAETLGRLVYCGFEIVNYQLIEDAVWFVVRKTKEPVHGPEPTTGWIAKMKRTGKNGTPINIYKLRTMYPYSEYIQEYIVKNNGYSETGKPNNDFRLLPYAKIIRKLYIDEIPQLFNLCRGDINIIGFRPLSQVGLQYLPLDIQEERKKYKPGLIPPQIALRLTGVEGVVKAERTYLADLKNGTLKTNFKYFFKAVFNLITMRAKGA